MKKRSASLWSSLFVMTAAMFIIVSFSGFSSAGEADGKTPDKNPGSGPSFDCSKAKTEVEKLICGSSELSKMDLELSETYSKFSSSLGDAEKASLKKEQIEWIKGRSKKIEEGILPADKPEDALRKREANLKKEYEVRIAVIKAQLDKQAVKDASADTGETAANQNQGKSEIDKASVTGEKPQDRKTTESASQNQSASLPPVKNEAEKAQRVKAILEKYPMHLDLKLSKDKKFCDEFFDALKRADKSIEYIEPVFKTDNPDDPGLKKYHSCDDAESRPDFTGRGEGLYDDISSVGDRNFKIYSLDMDGNPKNGLEEYIYAEIDTEVTGVGTIPGYTRIDFRKCEYEDSVPIYQSKERGHNWLKENYNAMIRYKGNIYIFDLSDARTEFDSAPGYSLSLTKYSTSKQKFERGVSGYWSDLIIDKYLKLKK